MARVGQIDLDLARELGLGRSDPGDRPRQDPGCPPLNSPRNQVLGRREIEGGFSDFDHALENSAGIHLARLTYPLQQATLQLIRNPRSTWMAKFACPTPPNPHLPRILRNLP